jgi:hypothetical protein
MSAEGTGRPLERLQRFGVAVVCSALGLHPAQLPLDEALTVARAWTRPVARWGRRHLSWPPRGRASRVGDVGPTIGRKVALWR